MSKITRRTALQGIGAASLLPLLPFNLEEQKEQPTYSERFHMPHVSKDFLIVAYNGHQPVLAANGVVDLAPDLRRELVQTVIKINIDDGLLDFSVSCGFFCSPIEVRDEKGKLKYRVSIHDPVDREERVAFCNGDNRSVPYIIMSRIIEEDAIPSWHVSKRRPIRLFTCRNGATIPHSLLRTEDWCHIGDIASAKAWDVKSVG